MTKNEYLFLQLAEECSEAAHRVSKLLRFGPDEVEEGNTVETNAERLRYELNDVLAVLDYLEELNLIQPVGKQTFLLHSQAKRAKIERYLKYSKELGTITE